MNDYKEYMKRSFLEYIEHLNEYNLDEPEFYENVHHYIKDLAIKEGYLNKKYHETFAYADYLINKLHEYVDIQKEDKMKDSESLTIKAV
ncbi:hypothetical protein E0663_17240 [Salmonella enterica subsp. enterica]|nr:hypothetical protein [Salmonella enterica subsp. enterica]